MSRERPVNSDQRGRGTPAEADRTRRGTRRSVANYTLRERLARHPAADAFLATTWPDGTTHVLYVLRRAARHDRSLIHRAIDEVAAARRLRHPSVPAVGPYGETPGGRFYVAVEHRAGRPLDEVVAEQGAVGVERLVSIAEPIVEALEEADAVGLTPGRLTPASVVLGPPDAQGREQTTLLGLGTAAVRGSPLTPEDLPYASPEEVAGADADARSRVFALASVLQFALEGAAPGSEGVGYDAARVLALARSPDATLRYPNVGSFWVALLSALVPVPGSEWDVTAPAPALPASSSVESDGERFWDSLAVVPGQGGPTPADEVVDVGDVGDVAEVAGAEGGRLADTAEAAEPWPPDAADSLGDSGGRRAAGTAATVALLVAGAALVVVGATTLARSVWSTRPGRVAAAPRAAGKAVASNSGGAVVRPTPNASGAARADSAASDSATPAPAAPRVADVPMPPAVLAIPAIDVRPLEPPRRAVVRADEFVTSGAAGLAGVPADELPGVAAARAAALAAARQDAQRAVEAFASALRARDLEALRRAAPEMPAGEVARWARVFKAARAVDADLTVTDVRPGGDFIVATVRSSVAVRLPGLRAPVRSDAESVTTLVRDSSGWRMRITP